MKILMTKYILIILPFLIPFGLDAQCEDNGNFWNNSWVSCDQSMSPNPIRDESHWLLFDFHETQFIDSTHIWNANRSGESGSGAKEVIIDYSEDGSVWLELGQYTFPRANESQDYSGFVGPNFDGKKVQKILITVISTHEGGNCASIAEILLSVDDDACFGIIDVCGVCDGPGETTWYIDADNDGLGDPNISITDCDQPAGFVEDNSDLCDNGGLGWADIGILFEEIGCINCHNQNAAGGLDLRSYETTLMGGNICGPNLLTSNHFVQTIMVSGYEGCGTAIGIPSMNDRSSGDFDQSELEKLQNWINGGFPELCTDFMFVFDADGDGFFSDVDCDDNNSDINPDAEEVPYNGIDEDCDPATLDDDLDQDGFILADDCDDNDADINPDAAEIPSNGIDEDCDGLDGTTSIFELADLTVLVYPIPTNHIINIEFSSPISFESKIYDIKGQLVHTSQNIIAINTQQMPAGLYILQLRDLATGQVVFDKFVVER
jgi:hypothetical protein